MSTILQIHRGTLNASTAMDRNLMEGELFLEIPSGSGEETRSRLKAGDGSTTYDSLPYLKDFTENEAVKLNADTSATNTDALAKVVSGANVGTIVSALKRAEDLNSTKLNGIEANAEVNQNAFTNVKVGETTIAADSKTDTLELAGSNVTLTPNASSDKVTIGITKTNVTDALGYTPPTSDTTYTAKDGVALNSGTFTNSGVRAVAEGTANGTINVNTNGSTADVSVHGLKALAYKDSLGKSDVGLANVADIDQSPAIKNITRTGTTFTATKLDGSTFSFTQQDNDTKYAGANGIALSSGTFTNAGVRDAVEGATNGTINFNINGSTSDVSVHGLKALAYKDSLTKSDVGLGNVANYDQSKAVKTITRSGTTFTATCIDGSTFSFTQQDNNTTYAAKDGIALNSNTFSNTGVRAIATGATAGTINVNTNGSTAEVAVKDAASAIKNITRSGTTFTATKLDGSTFSFTQQDTTYKAKDGVTLSSGTFTNSGVRAIATGGSTGTINVNTNGSTANVSVNGLGTAASKNYETTVTSGSNNLITSGAVYTAIDNLPEPMVFKGSLGTGGTITALPVNGTASIGDTYKVITAGTYASKAAKVGDTFICLTKTSSANTWELIPSGDEPSGTVTSIATGAGLTGGTITTSGTLKANLRSETKLTNDSAAATETSGRVYPVAVDKSGYLAVNVPWTDNNTTYKAKDGITLSSGTFTNSGVRSIATGTTAASINVNTNGSTADVIVKDAGLGVKSITRSGKTFTATCIDGSTFSFTQQDSNTTYTGTDGITLNSGTFTNSGVRSIATGTTAGSINVNTNGSTANVAVKDAGLGVKSITRSGTTFTATCIDGSTFSFTQQDSNTTYSGASGVSLTGTTFYNSGVRAITTSTVAGSINVNTNGTTANVAIKDAASAIKNITRSGTTFTATKLDGSTFTFTQQDNNTTYAAGTGLALNSNTFSLSTSGASAGSYGPSANVDGTNGTTMSVPYITVDAYGRVTGISNKTYTSRNTDTDTKNTAGSTDTSSKIFLIGATSQAANPQTYSDNEVYVTSGVLTTKSVQVGGTAATIQYNSTNKCIDFVFA